jgi:autotransporter-associated beta strand protein
LFRQTIVAKFGQNAANGVGFADSGINFGAIRSGGNTLSGTITLGGNARIGSFAGAGGTIAGQITGSGGYLEFLNGNSANNNSGTFTLQNTGAANNYNGNTLISSMDYNGGNFTGCKTILKLGASEQIPNGGGNGLLFFNGPNANHLSVFELNGLNETVNGLTNVAASGAVIQNTTTGASTLTIGDANTNSSFSGVISDGGAGKTLAITKIGSGTLTLSGVNTYLGRTTISGGTLALSGSGSLASSLISVAGGATFDTSTASFTLGAGQVLSNTASATAQLAGPLSSGSGTISVSFVNGTPSFNVASGALTLSASTILAVNNTGATLIPGTYKIISKSGGGSVAGTAPTSFSVVNGPTVVTPALSIAGGELYLTVGGTSSISYTGSGPFTYDGAAHGPSASFSGSTGAQTSAFVGVSVSYGPSVNAPTNAGTYYLSNTVAADANYFGANNSQSFTINPAALAITASNASKSYGQAVTYGAGSTAFAFGGSQNGETIGSVTITASGGTAATDAPGTYSLVPSAATGGTFNPANYTITYNNGTLTVNPASLLVQANSTSRAFGATNPAFTATFTGFVNGQTPGTSDVGGTPALTTTADTNSPVGTYAITAAPGSLTSTNYSFVFTNGTLTVAPAAITVTADNQLRSYGAANPTLTANYTGFVNGDTSSVISGSPTLTTSAVTNSPVGSYVITNSPGSLSATNYSFTLVNGTLTVTPTPLGLTANNDSKTYDGTGYTGGNGVTYSGFVNGETAAVLGGTLSYGGTSQNATNAGSYSIILSGLTSSNYAITYTNGSLTINPLAIAVTADAKAKVYGAADPALTYAYSPSLISGDSFSGALSRAGGENVGSYAINQNTLALSANYTLGYTGANLSITPAALGITANSTSKSYGVTTIFAGTEFTASGLQFSDSVAGVALASAGATNTAVVGSYPIVASAAVGTGLGNYTITYNNGTLTVNPASASVTASSTANPSGYKDSVAFLAALPTDASGSVVFASAGGAISTNSISSGTATSLSVTNLPRGTNAITVAYFGDSNYTGSTNTFSQIVTNHPPVAGNAGYARNAALNTFKIAVTNLLGNATDVDGDTLALASISATTNGALAIIGGGYVLYYNTNAVADQFTYTVADGFGGTNSATVTLTIDSTPLFGQSQIASASGGTATLNFAGIPGYSYSISRSTDLLTWTTIGTTNAPAGGGFEFIDTSAPSPSAFYRLQYNP